MRLAASSAGVQVLSAMRGLFPALLFAVASVEPFEQDAFRPLSVFARHVADAHAVAHATTFAGLGHREFGEHAGIRQVELAQLGQACQATHEWATTS